MDEIGYTAMHLCAERGYLDLVQLLIQHKAKVCFTDTTKGPAALGNPPRPVLADEPLRLAIKNGHYEVAEVKLSFRSYRFQPVASAFVLFFLMESLGNRVCNPVFLLGVDLNKQKTFLFNII